MQASLRSLVLAASSAAALPIVSGQGTWSTTAAPVGGRYDDICFLDPDTGWACGGPTSNSILHTTNGGVTWYLQWGTMEYLRSIEFINDSVGLCGSLFNALYRTTDGGTTWTDIAPTMTVQPQGFCGLSAVAPQTFYSCGIWSSPAFVIRSDDAGTTWDFIDMSPWASSLVDVWFTSPDSGFVSGASIVPAEGGIVLRTTDGGATWSPVHTTGVPGDIVWKIQRLDGAHWFGSVYGQGVVANTRMIRSDDGGLSWEDREVANYYTYTEGVGFLDTLVGWVGGDQELFTTTDGGDTWQSQVMGSEHNRFQRVNSGLVYASGAGIYKYSGGPMGVVGPTADLRQHQLSAHIAANGDLVLELDLTTSTTAIVEVRAASGQLIARPFFERRASGKHTLRVPANGMAPGAVIVSLRTNEGPVSVKVMR